MVEYLDKILLYLKLLKNIDTAEPYRCIFLGSELLYITPSLTCQTILSSETRILLKASIILSIQASLIKTV